jgi:hypothetical protein
MGGAATGGQAAGGSALGGQAMGAEGGVGTGRPANWLQRLAAALGIGGNAGGGIDKNYY